MWLDEHSPIRKQDLVLDKPLVNAAGALGFAPDPSTMPFLECLGAFIAHPISRSPRVPAGSRVCLPYPGGFLLHTGLPNPGIGRAVSRYKRRWASSPLPVIVHLLVETPETLAEMVRKLEGLENILAVELGLPPECDAAGLHAIMEASVGELPVIVSVSPEQVSHLLEPLRELNPVAVHLTEPRGTLPDQVGKLVSGRLYGPAVFPVMMQAAQTLVNTGLMVIANGGINAPWQVDAMQEVGVSAVGLGAVLWGIFPEDMLGFIWEHTDQY